MLNFLGVRVRDEENRIWLGQTWRRGAVPVLHTLHGVFSRPVIGFCAFAMLHSVNATDQRRLLEP